MNARFQPSLKTLLSACLLVAMSGNALAQEAPVVKSSSGGTLKTTTHISQGFLPKHDTRELWATIRVKSGAAVRSTDRAPLNISLVIDRSTSMSGGKLEQAKLAGTRLVDMLSAEDRLAIVSYGSDVTTELTSMQATGANKELMHNAIRNVRLSGSTNLSGGYQRGVDLVMPHNRDETVNRVLLLSDGQANVGLTHIGELESLSRQNLERGVSLSTMGIGLDYNEELMTAMAQHGAGNYYFIENERALAGIFEKECQGLSSTVAKRTVLTIEVAPGVELLEIQGFPHKLKGSKATIQLAEFFANQRKDIVARVGVTTGDIGKMPILSTKLVWNDVARDKRVSTRTRVAAVVTNDKKALATVEKPVMKRVEQVQIANTMNKAVAAFERGDKKKAVKLLEDQRRSTRANAKSYDFEADEAFGRVSGEMEEMQQQIETKSSGSDDGKRLRKAQKKRAYDISNSAALF